MTEVAVSVSLRILTDLTLHIALQSLIVQMVPGVVALIRVLPLRVEVRIHSLVLLISHLLPLLNLSVQDTMGVGSLHISLPKNRVNLNVLEAALSLAAVSKIRWYVVQADHLVLRLINLLVLIVKSLLLFTFIIILANKT